MLLISPVEIICRILSQWKISLHHIRQQIFFHYKSNSKQSCIFLCLLNSVDLDDSMIRSPVHPDIGAITLRNKWPHSGGHIWDPAHGHARLIIQQPRSRANGHRENPVILKESTAVPWFSSSGLPQCIHNPTGKCELPLTGLSALRQKHSGTCVHLSMSMGKDGWVTHPM